MKYTPHTQSNTCPGQSHLLRRFSAAYAAAGAPLLCSKRPLLNALRFKGVLPHALCCKRILLHAQRVRLSHQCTPPISPAQQQQVAAFSDAMATIRALHSQLAAHMFPHATLLQGSCRARPCPQRRLLLLLLLLLLGSLQAWPHILLLLLEQRSRKNAQHSKGLSRRHWGGTRLGRPWQRTPPAPDAAQRWVAGVAGVAARVLHLRVPRAMVGGTCSSVCIKKDRGQGRQEG